MSALVDRLTELQSAWADSVCPWKDDPVQPEVLQARRDCPEYAGGIVYNADVARVVIERHGHERAAIVPVEDMEALERLEDQLDVAAAEAALAESDDRIPWERVKKDLGL